MVSCGRVRKNLSPGWTTILEGELENLGVAALLLESGKRHTLRTGEREYAVVLVRGDCVVEGEGGFGGELGPRENPFDTMPHAVFLTRGQTVTIEAAEETLLAVSSAPAAKKMSNHLITPGDIKTGTRGADNWQREVRMICWSDNTDGNMLLAGETCTPSGNWSTVPPHRHQYDIEGEEVPYEEAYFFQFSRPTGFGLIWEFDEESGMDRAFSVKSGDVAYNNAGYHPVVCAPGSILYHTSFMAGPRRISKASLHPDYRFLLDERDMANQYTPGEPGR